MRWGAVRGSIIGTALTQSVPCTSPDVQLNVILCTSLSAFKANVSNVERVPCDHRTVRLVRRSRKVIVSSNPTNSGHTSKPNIFTFPPLKMCGLLRCWGIDFSVVVVVAAAAAAAAVVTAVAAVLIPKLQCVRMPITVTFYRW